MLMGRKDTPREFRAPRTPAATMPPDADEAAELAEFERELRKSGENDARLARILRLLGGGLKND